MVGGPVIAAALIASLAYGLSATAQESSRSTGASETIANIRSWAHVALSGEPQGSVGTVRREPPRSVERPAPPRIDEAERELKARLASAKLSAARVDAAGGRLAVSGQIGRQDVAAWTAIQQWFDQTYGDHLVLTTTVTVADGKAAPVLQPQAIWYGEGAYVVAADGVRYYEGAVLENGWTIQSIGADRILLSRDGQTTALTYQ
jgi:type III secretion protein D